MNIEQFAADFADLFEAETMPIEHETSFKDLAEWDSLPMIKDIKWKV